MYDDDPGVIGLLVLSVVVSAWIWGGITLDRIEKNTHRTADAVQTTPIKPIKPPVLP